MVVKLATDNVCIAFIDEYRFIANSNVHGVQRAACAALSDLEEVVEMNAISTVTLF